MRSDKDLLDEIDMICIEQSEEDKQTLEKNQDLDVTNFNVKDMNDEFFNVSNIQFSNIQFNGKNSDNCVEDIYSLHENIELNEIYQYLNCGDHKELYDQIQYMSDIINEDDQLLEFFSKSVSDCKTTNELVSYFDALAYEDKIRVKHKREKLAKIKEVYTKKMNYFKDIKNYTSRLYYEVKLLKNLHDIKKERHGGTYMDKNAELMNSDSDIYDWIVDIDLITKISTVGWMVTFSKSFFNNSNNHLKKNVVGGFRTNQLNTNMRSMNDISPRKTFEMQTPKNTTGSTRQMQRSNSQSSHTSFTGKDSGFTKMSSIDSPNSNSWEGAIVAVVGLYDKGKTFVLNNISFSNLPSGKKVNTKGLSFKYVNIDEGTKLIIQDTAGSYSPVKVENNMSIIEKEATEMFIQDLVFEISDYFLFVVNDFTSQDQRYQDKLTRSLQNSPSKAFREVIVIHNFKEVENQDILSHIWETQVKQIYSQGHEQFTKVAARNPLTGKLEEKTVSWFKSPFTRHVCLVNQDSIFGYNVNPWSFSLIRYWLKAVFVPQNRNFSVVDNVISVSEQKLSYYFKTNIKLSLIDTDDKYTKKITNNSSTESLRLPQLAIDSSGLVLTRPDSFIPSTDIIKGEEYCIYLDLPGVDMKDIQILRNNVTTVVKGKRIKIVDEERYRDNNYVRNERKFGEFTQTFKIPEMYERKWYSYELVDGVLGIFYKKDNDDVEISDIDPISQNKDSDSIVKEKDYKKDLFMKDKEY